MFKRLLSVFLCVCAVVSVCTAMPASAQEACGFSQNDMLTTKGRRIVNQSGKKVTLKGVNLGSWLVQESWMSPVESSEDNLTTFNVLTQRFGADGAYALINGYQDNWITEEDFDTIARLGYNCVRVPFWYRNFYSDEKGTKILDENGEWDFSRLDWIVSECSQRRIYVILDLHGAQGSQNAAQHSGTSGVYELYSDSAYGELCRKLTAELWRYVAKRYKGNPAVAMFDLLNEPLGDVDGLSDEQKDKYIADMYAYLYDAVREEDSDRIITMCGIWRINNLPMPSKMGWENVIYQLHLYDSANIKYFFIALATRLHPSAVPVLIGEFKPMGDATWNSVLGIFNFFGFSWTTWSYKGSGNGADKSDWFVYGSSGIEKADVKNDSYEEIQRKWGEALRTDKSFSYTGLCDTVRKYF
ncbi:MAG: cellulase family glycosylhydrolase [Clostridia bacterium]|nr:cellulase family glycosylhydrolase [Clostridia bacterium]